MRILGIIPARYASTRFPGKPLAVINGKSMLERVVEQAHKAERLDAVLVATDDQRIYDHVHSFGGEAVMTASTHESGTERCLEAASHMSGPVDAVINIQGDEPFILPEQINLVAQLIEEGADIATLAIPLPYTFASDPNKVKVVCNHQGRALYFSRSPIPFYRDGAPTNATLLKHLGIYGYRFGTLTQIARSPMSPLEKAEKLEQLRWLEMGYEIQVGETDYESPAIDTPEDLMRVLRELK